MNTSRNGNLRLTKVSALWFFLQFALAGHVFGHYKPQGEEFQINTHIPWEQDHSQTAGLPGGGFVVTWESLDQDGSLWGVFGQVFSSSGEICKKGLVLDFGPAYGLYHYDQAGGWKQWNTVNPSHMVTIELNGDGTDELLAAFPGYGLYKKDSANDWQRINTVNPEKMIAADIDGDGDEELIAAFTGYGLYYYDDLGGWSPPINDFIPDIMVRYSDGLVCDFGGVYGLWSYNLSDGWVLLNEEDPDKIVAADIDGDGKHELVVSFVGWGLYTYEPEGKMWDPINTVIPDQIIAVDIDGDRNNELVMSFPGYGLYTYEPEGRIWDPISTEIPEGIIRQGNGIAADYGETYGLWTWSCGNGWQQRNTVDPGEMTVVDIDKDSVGELVVSFPGYGLYYFDEIDGWQLLNAVVPVDMQPCMRRPDYVPCLSDDACEDGQVCDRSECLSCCPSFTGACISACCGKCVDELGDFCGWSSNGPCAADADCMTGGCSGQVCQSTSEDPIITTCEWRECYSAKTYGVSCGCVNARCQWK